MLQKFHNFAPVAPIQILEEMFAQSPRLLFGDYHLFLAHHTVPHAGRFKDLVDKFHHHWNANPVTIIMDNSLVECGMSVSLELVRDATFAVTSEATTVIPVLPDVMGNGAATCDAVDAAYEEWVEAMPRHNFMVVLQGATWMDFVRTANHLLLDKKAKYSKIQWVGIPRKLVEKVGTRQKCIEYVKMIAPWVDIHLLGFSDDMLDDFHCARIPGVRGIDSAVPVRVNDLLLPTDVPEPRDPEWMETGRLNPIAQANITNVRNWIRPRHVD
jgi:hypothetical protein